MKPNMGTLDRSIRAVAGIVLIALWPLGLLQGTLRVETEGSRVELQPGQFCTLPAGMGAASLSTPDLVEFLQINPG